MEAHTADGDWRSTVRSLRGEWNAALESAAPTGRWPDEPASLDELVDDALGYFDEGSTLTTQAAYSTNGTVSIRLRVPNFATVSGAIVW